LRTSAPCFHLHRARRFHSIHARTKLNPANVRHHSPSVHPGISEAGVIGPTMARSALVFFNQFRPRGNGPAGATGTRRMNQ